VAIRVFLVEDMQQVRGVLAELLSTVGDFRLVAAVGTEAEAKHWLSEHPGAWDLAIVDLVLEQGSGLAVVSRASETRADGGNVIVFSDYAGGGIRAHCEKLGADRVFLKSETRELMDYCSELGGLAATAA